MFLRLVGPNWPASGEIDIIEGVHTSTTNSMTLHSSSGCTITNNNQFSGTIQTSNCDGKFVDSLSDRVFANTFH